MTIALAVCRSISAARIGAAPMMILLSLAIQFGLPGLGWSGHLVATEPPPGLISTPVIKTESDRFGLDQLRAIQQRVQSVSRQNMDACVAISDGIGFGSGVIISADGLILTAGHVITGPGPYEVILPTGQTVKAKRLGMNLGVDSGMVQIIEKGPWPFVEVADVKPLAAARDPMLGEWVICLGHSGGFELGRLPPIRTGRVLSRKKNHIVTDAVLIGGDSGGPLFDLSGRLIGIHSSIGDSIAENRHITVDVFRRDWQRLLKGEAWGKLPELNDPTEQKRAGKIGVIVDRTAAKALIKSVKEETPAAEAGLRTGDVIHSFNQVVIRDGDHLIEQIKRYHAGDVFPMVVARNGKLLSFEIQLK